MRQRVELLLSVLFLLGLIAASRSIGKYVSSAQVEDRKAVVVVDAGHGGAYLRRLRKIFQRGGW